MPTVSDKVGREFHFDRIRFKMDEALLQQAASEVLDETSGRAQLVFDRYCFLHFEKYRRNYEPSHFSRGRLLERFTQLYATYRRSIVVRVVVTEGALFEKYIGQPAEYIEQAVRLDPRSWVQAGLMLCSQEP